jgi:hypothetical protein
MQEAQEKRTSMQEADETGPDGGGRDGERR